MKKFLMLFFILPAVHVFPQETQKAPDVVPQKEFMDIILKNAPALVSEKLAVEAGKINIKSTDAADDTAFSAGSSYYSKEYDSAASQSGLNGTTGFNNYASLSKKFSATGTELSGTLNYDTQRSDYDSGTDGRLYSPSAEVSLRQPLLNNFFGKVDRYSKKTAIADYEISQLNYTVKEKEISDYYAALYCKWIIYRRIVNYNSENAENARIVYSQTQRKFDARLAENDDLQKAYSSLLSNRQALESSRLLLRETENEIFTAAGRNDFIPDDAYLDEVYGLASSNEYASIGFSKTLNYRIMNMTLQKVLLKSETAENSMLPEFDIIASLMRKDSDDVNSQAWNFDKTEYSVGFEFTYKFGNNAAEAEHEKAMNALDSYRESVRQTEFDYRNSLDDILKGVETYKRIIDYQEKNLTALRSALATERKKYAQARITLSNLITTENSIASIRTSILNSRLALINYYFRYMSLVREQ